MRQKEKQAGLIVTLCCHVPSAILIINYDRIHSHNSFARSLTLFYVHSAPADSLCIRHRAPKPNPRILTVQFGELLRMCDQHVQRFISALRL